MTTSEQVERLVAEFLAQHPVDATPDRELRGARYDAGLAFVHFGKGFGGLGLDPSCQATVEQMFGSLGLALAGPNAHSGGGVQLWHAGAPDGGGGRGGLGYGIVQDWLALPEQ